MFWFCLAAFVVFNAFMGGLLVFGSPNYGGAPLAYVLVMWAMVFFITGGLVLREGNATMRKILGWPFLLLGAALVWVGSAISGETLEDDERPYH